MLRTLHRPLRHRCRMQSHLPHRCRSRAQCDLTKRSRKYPFLPVPSPHRTHDHPAIPGQPPPRGIKTSDASRSPNVLTLPTSSQSLNVLTLPTSSRSLNVLTPPQQPRDAAAPKGPRASSGFRQHFFSLHSLPFPLPPHSRQHTAPVKLRAQTAWVEGAGFLLARRKMRWRPGDTYLSNASCELCPRTSALSIFLGA
jgi:hypothetical protein